MDKFYLIPNDGRSPRDPLTGKPLRKEGEYKPKTNYWLRRVRDKDVTVSDPPTSTAPATKGKQTAKAVAAPAAATTTKGDAQ